MIAKAKSHTRESTDPVIYLFQVLTPHNRRHEIVGYSGEKHAFTKSFLADVSMLIDEALKFKYPQPNKNLESRYVVGVPDGTWGRNGTPLPDNERDAVVRGLEDSGLSVTVQ